MGRLVGAFVGYVVVVRLLIKSIMLSYLPEYDHNRKHVRHQKPCAQGIAAAHHETKYIMSYSISIHTGSSRLPCYIVEMRIKRLVLPVKVL